MRRLGHFAPQELAPLAPVEARFPGALVPVDLETEIVGLTTVSPTDPTTAPGRTIPGFED